MINKINKIINEIATDHILIKEYGFGDIWELEKSKNREYMLLWADPTQATFNPKTTTLQLNLYIMDRVGDGEWGEINTQSETLIVLRDVITILKRKYELVNEDSVNTVQPFTENFGGKVTGWFASVSIELEMIYGVCDVPMEA